MRKEIIINGKHYEPKELTYNEVCLFEEAFGLSIEEYNQKPNAFTRAYMAICMNCSLEEAGQEITNHVINGGKIEDPINAFSEALTESDFFLALLKGTEEETQPAPKKKAEKKQENITQ